MSKKKLKQIETCYRAWHRQRRQLLLEAELEALWFVCSYGDFDLV